MPPLAHISLVQRHLARYQYSVVAQGRTASELDERDDNQAPATYAPHDAEHYPGCHCTKPIDGGMVRQPRAVLSRWRALAPDSAKDRKTPTAEGG
jgi:hypothetical protein